MSAKSPMSHHLFCCMDASQVYTCQGRSPDSQPIYLATRWTTWQQRSNKHELIWNKADASTRRPRPASGRRRCSDTASHCLLLANERVNLSSRFEPLWLITRLRGSTVWLHQQSTGQIRKVHSSKVDITRVVIGHVNAHCHIPVCLITLDIHDIA